MLAGVCLLMLFAGGAHSQPESCDRPSCPHEIRIASVAEDKLYGLLLQAPEAGCRQVRYRVETIRQALLGKTPVLTAGEVAVVRIGNGYRAGAHTLIVTGEGCGKAPDLSRRVTLRKTSPDHGWRAALVMAVLAAGD
jgi:hypothetical protein